MRHAALLLLALLAPTTSAEPQATPAAPPPTPSPTAVPYRPPQAWSQGEPGRKTVEIPDPSTARDPSADQPKRSLSDYAAGMKGQPARGPGAVSGGASDRRLRVVSLTRHVAGGIVDVTGQVVNASSSRLHVLIVAEGRRADGSRVSDVVATGEGEPLEPGEVVGFTCHLRGALHDSVRVRAGTASELIGTIETAEERRLRHCVAYEALLPGAVDLGARSLEVRARNGCEKEVPADKTWFQLIVRNAIGEVVAHRVDRMEETIPARGSTRREVTVKVPVGAKVTIGGYEPN